MLSSLLGSLYVVFFEINSIGVRAWKMTTSDINYVVQVPLDHRLFVSASWINFGWRTQINSKRNQLTPEYQLNGVNNPKQLFLFYHKHLDSQYFTVLSSPQSAQFLSLSYHLPLIFYFDDFFFIFRGVGDDDCF